MKRSMRKRLSTGEDLVATLEDIDGHLLWDVQLVPQVKGDRLADIVRKVLQTELGVAMSRGISPAYGEPLVYLVHEAAKAHEFTVDHVPPSTRRTPRGVVY